MKKKTTFMAALLCLATVSLVEAQSLPTARPEQVGLSSERLNKLTATLKADVDKGVIPGAVVLVARHGKVALFQAVGARNPESRAPMTKDSIFRIYSMSKPITSVAAMMLFEDGKFTLGEPVSKYIPELGGLKVGVEKPDPSGKPALELVPAKRDMTIHDLFRHTSGLTYGFFGNTLVKKMYVESKVWNDYPSNAELVARLARMPLAYQPGTTWDYSHSTDVLGRLIEVITRRTLYQYEKERVLDPLGMKDTASTSPTRASRTASSSRSRTTGTSASTRTSMTRGSRRRGSPAAAAWSPPPWTTRASPRCCSTAARSTASASWVPRRSPT
jgi:CubicO group peptidase (beta-lactamase class C family)